VQATQILTAHRHAVLLGDAGAGKSTFLATVAGDFAARARSRRGRGDIAVIVPAADLVGRRLPDALARAVHRDLAVDLPAEVFERPPAGGRSWRVLLDGLDEVVAAQDRSEVLWRIKGLLADSGSYRFVFTCRPLAAPELAELHGPAVGVYDLRSFDRRELDEFAHRWFAARFPDDRRRADRTAGRFLAGLRAPDSVRWPGSRSWRPSPLSSMSRRTTARCRPAVRPSMTASSIIYSTGVARWTGSARRSSPIC
jgi:predicted NACHT family NTPase